MSTGGLKNNDSSVSLDTIAVKHGIHELIIDQEEGDNAFGRVCLCVCVYLSELSCWNR